MNESIEELKEQIEALTKLRDQFDPAGFANTVANITQAIAVLQAALIDAYYRDQGLDKSPAA